MMTRRRSSAFEATTKWPLSKHPGYTPMYKISFILISPCFWLRGPFKTVY